MALCPHPKLSPPGAARGAVHTSGLSSDTSAKETGRAGYPGRMHAGGSSPDSLAKTCVQTAKPKRVQKACGARSSTSSPHLFRKLPRSPTSPALAATHPKAWGPTAQEEEREAIQGGLIQATLAWLEHLFFFKKRAGRCSFKRGVVNDTENIIQSLQSWAPNGAKLLGFTTPPRGQGQRGIPEDKTKKEADRGHKRQVGAQSTGRSSGLRPLGATSSSGPVFLQNWVTAQCLIPVEAPRPWAGGFLHQLPV